MNDIKSYGVDPTLIANCMARAITFDEELIFRLETAGMYEEIEMVRQQALSCYKVLASVYNYREMECYREGHVNPRVFNISDFLNDLLSRTKLKMRRSDIQFDYEVENGLVCECDSDRLAACLMNLIVNAYSNVDQEMGHVRVTVKKLFDYAAVSVVDDGYGMTNEEFSRQMNSDGTRGLNLLREFCKTVGIEPIIDAKAPGGVSLTIRIPLASQEGLLKLESSFKPIKNHTLSPCEVLLFKLDDVFLQM